MIERPRRPAGDYVAILLAFAIGSALNLVTAALLYAAVARYHAGGELALSENGVQLLTGWGGGIVGVLGAYVGYSFRKQQRDDTSGDDQPPPQ